PLHQLADGRIHGLHRPVRVALSREDRPALRQRVDPALVVDLRAQRRAVVEVGPAVPLAVPGRLLHRPDQLPDAPAAGFSVLLIAAPLGQLGEAPQAHHLEPGDPHTLALATGADLVHAVVPVAAAHERQAVLAQLPAVLQRPLAVLVERA